MEDTLDIAPPQQESAPPQEDPKIKLWKAMSSNGDYTKSFDEFKSQFNSPDKVSSLYKALSTDKAYTKTEDDFYNQYFQEFKKKDVPSKNGGQVGTSVPQSEPDVHKLRNLSDLKAEGVSPQQQQDIKNYVVATDKEHKAKVNDAINTTTDFYKAATKYFTGKENELQNDVPEEQKGEHVSNFLNNPNVIERAKTDPAFAQHYKEAKFNWINDFPDAAKKNITQKIGQHLEDTHQTGILYNNPGKQKVDQAVNELAVSGELDPHEVYKYNQDIRPHVGTTKSLLFGSPIPTSDYVNTISKSLERSGGNIVEGMRDAADKISFGTISKFGESRAAHQERVLNDIYSEPQVESKASGANKIGLNIADMVGFALPAVLGEMAGVPTMATLGTQFYGQNKKDGMVAFPENENKQDAYAALTTGIDLIAGEKLPIKGLGESIRGLVDDAAAGKITQAAAKNKYLSFLNDTFKGAVQGANAVEVMKVGHNAANAVFGGSDFNVVDQAKQVLRDYPQDALGMAFFSGIHAAAKSVGRGAEAKPSETPEPEKLFNEKLSLEQKYSKTEMEDPFTGEKKETTVKSAVRTMEKQHNILENLIKCLT